MVAFFYNRNNASPETTTTNEANDYTPMALSLKEIIAKNEDLECTTRRADGTSGFRATIYIHNNRAKVDFEGQVYDPITDSLEKNNSSYIVDLKDTEKKYPFDINNQYFNYQCKPWVVDQKVFEI